MGTGRSERHATQSVARPLLVLLLLTLVTQLAALAYNMSVAAAAPDAAEQSLWFSMAFGALVLCVLTIPLAGLGLLLGRGIGLGAPLLNDLLERRPGAGEWLRRDALLAIPLGLGIGVALLLLRTWTASYLPPELPAFGHRGAIAGLLLSVAAAIAEEAWLRLGIMTILAWPVVRLLGDSETRPSVAWSANVLAALAFGLIHIPQLAQFGAATPSAVFGTMFGNGIVGITCGWLYWRRSLVAAILAHFAVDLVLHVFTALAP